MAFDEKSNNDYTALGEGSYGLVFHPALPNQENNGKRVDYPTHVGKLFFEEDDYRHLMNKTNALSDIFPSYQLPQSYRRSFTVKNLPRKLRNHLNVSLSNNDPVYVSRIPYLGRSLEDLIGLNRNYGTLAAVRQCPIWKILREITKLLSYTYKMTEKGYLHGDISLGNIVLDEKECKIYLIDFDWFYPYTEYYQERARIFGKATDPPETLFLPTIRYLPRIFVPTRLSNKPGTRNNPYKQLSKTKKNSKRGNIDYANKLQHRFPHVWSYLLRHKRHSTILSSIKKNITYLTPHIQSNTTDTSLFSQIAPYFDNYGLGLCLSEFLLALYPLPEEGDEESFIDFLKDSGQTLPPHLRNHEEYATKTVYAIRQTIDLLLTMSSFLIEKRPPPEEAYKSMEVIFHDYLTELKIVGMPIHLSLSLERYRKKKRKPSTQKNRS